MSRGRGSKLWYSYPFNFGTYFLLTIRYNSNTGIIKITAAVS